MSRYSLSLPKDLKREAELQAAQQGVSLNQFILWAVSEKIGALTQKLDDPAYPRITSRRGASGLPTAVLRGSGIRVQAIVAAQRTWQLSGQEIAEEYGLSANQVKEALAFYNAHPNEIDSAIAAEHSLESAGD